MSRHEPIPEPWFSFLKELDALTTTSVSLHCIGGFVVTMLYGLSRTTGDLDVLEVAPKSAADAFAKVAMRGGELHQKYKVYLDLVGGGSPASLMTMKAVCVKCFPELFGIFASWHSIHTILRSPSWNAISNVTAVMCAIWPAPYLSTYLFFGNSIRPSYAPI